MNIFQKMKNILRIQKGLPFPVKIAAENIACEEFLKIIIEQAPFGIYTINREGIIDSFNQKMVELAGAKSASEVIGLNTLTLPTYKEAGLTEHFSAGLAGKAFELPAVKYVSYTGKKTSYRLYRGVPVIDKTGNTSKLVLFVTDVTEKIELQEALEQLKAASEHNQSLASIIENSFEGVMIVEGSPKQIIKYINPAWERTTGWRREEVVDEQSPRILKSGKHEQSFYQNLWETIKAGKTFSSEIVNKRKDGSLYDAEIVIFPIKDEKGETVYAEISRDISERKRNEAKLRQNIEEIERINKFLTGREIRMNELKKEITELKKRLGEQEE